MSFEGHLGLSLVTVWGESSRKIVKVGGSCFDLGSGSNLRIVHVVLVVVVNDISIVFHPSHLVGY